MATWGKSGSAAGARPARAVKCAGTVRGRSSRRGRALCLSAAQVVWDQRARRVRGLDRAPRALSAGWEQDLPVDRGFFLVHPC